MFVHHFLVQCKVWAVALVASLLWAVGCASDTAELRWDAGYVGALGLQDRGQLGEARQRLEALQASAKRPADRRVASLALAEILALEGDEERAAAALEAIWRVDVGDEAGARAMLRHGELLAGPLGRPDEAQDLFTRLAARYPSFGEAEEALDRLEAEALAGGEVGALLERLETIYGEVRGEELADDVLFAIARVQREALADEAAALGTLRRLVSDHPESGHADDALWEMAEIYRRHQQWDQAERLWSMLARDVESSWLVGIYHSQWADDARFALGRVALLHRDDLGRAIAHFERFQEDFPSSLLVDDAAWHTVEATRLTGDTPTYRVRLEAFAREHPDSRWARVARRRLQGKDPRAAAGGRPW